jgi:hypothetical protein
MALANLRDDPKAFEHFASLEHFASGNRESLNWLFVDKPEWWAFPEDNPPAFVPEKLVHLYRQREALRKVWRGDMHMLAGLLIPPVDDEYQEETDSEGRTIGFVREQLPIFFDWQSSRIVYVPQTVFQNALYLLFKESQRAKVCPNPDCPAPYFIAPQGKPNQRYCSLKCTGEGLRESKRRSWAKHKEEWRPKRKERSARRKKH